jgi:hypothetical protein
LQRITRAISILRPTGIALIDIDMRKNHMPLAKARFCARALRIPPIFEQVHLEQDKGGKRNGDEKT